MTQDKYEDEYSDFEDGIDLNTDILVMGQYDRNELL